MTRQALLDALDALDVADSETLITVLEEEGIVFADRTVEVETLARLSPKDRAYFIARIVLPNYRRRGDTLTQPPPPQ